MVPPVQLSATARVRPDSVSMSQALVPACCTVLFNAHGTAPGMWFEREGRVVVSLPGVPFEMEHLMQDEVMPRLKARFALKQIVHRTLITTGLAESMLAKVFFVMSSLVGPSPPVTITTCDSASARRSDTTVAETPDTPASEN